MANIFKNILTTRWWFVRRGWLEMKKEDYQVVSDGHGHSVEVPLGVKSVVVGSGVVVVDQEPSSIPDSVVKWQSNLPKTTKKRRFIKHF